MWPFYPAARRKSSSSSHPPIHSPPLSPRGPIFASAIAESPDPAQPYFTSPTHVYPETPAHLSRVDEDPGYTGHSESASAIGASGGSRKPLLHKDFARRAMDSPIDEDHSESLRRGEEGNSETGSFIVVPDRLSTTALPTPTALQPPPMAKRSEPLLVPPASVHDAYVSSFRDQIDRLDATPTQPPTPDGGVEQERPPIFRTASAPGHTFSSSNTRKLLPSPLLPSKRSPEGTTNEIVDGTPIFDIFDANLSTSSVEMVKALKGHLEQVLRVQEEIGRMHLSLEKLSVVAPGSWEDFEGTPGKSTGTGTNVTPSTGLKSPGRRSTPGESDRVYGSGGTKSSASPGHGPQDTPGARAKQEAEEALLEREKGVDEIMERLGSLSETLRTYHTLGTPRLSFPGSSAPVTSTFPVTPSDPTPPQTFTKTSPTKGDPTKSTQVTSPHIAVANLRGQALPPAPLQSRVRSSSTLGRSAFSRSMTTLEESDTDRPEEGSFWDPATSYGRRGSAETTGTERVRGPETKRNTNLSPLSLAEGSARLGGWSFAETAQNGEKDGQGDEQSWVEYPRRKSLEPTRDRIQREDRHWVDSPLEMVDRSRPW